MNEELQENARATELELREELDMKSIKLLEVLILYSAFILFCL